MPSPILSYARPAPPQRRIYGGVSRTLFWLNVASMLVGLGTLFVARGEFGVLHFLLWPILLMLITGQFLASVLPTARCLLTLQFRVAWWEWLALVVPMVVGIGCTVGCVFYFEVIL